MRGSLKTTSENMSEGTQTKLHGGLLHHSTIQEVGQALASIGYFVSYEAKAGDRRVDILAIKGEKVLVIEAVVSNYNGPLAEQDVKQLLMTIQKRGDEVIIVPKKTETRVQLSPKTYSNEDNITEASAASLEIKLCGACGDVHPMSKVFYRRPSMEKIHELDELHDFLEGTTLSSASQQVKR